MTESWQESISEGSCEAVIESSVRITPESSDEVRQLVLRITEPAFRYAAGQSIGVMVPGPHAFGNPMHHRRYSIANPAHAGNEESIALEILVRRCFYIDEISGERYPGIASNYLCDARPGDRIRITGPYRSPFKIPGNNDTNLLMIGTGTGVAPFRAFVRQIYERHGGWKGRVRLFYGDQGGMNLLYLNDRQGDLDQYYDEATFKAFSGLVDRPLADASEGLAHSLSGHIEECGELLRDPKTHLFIAGQERAAAIFERLMAESLDSEEEWLEMKGRMIQQERWAELLYH